MNIKDFDVVKADKTFIKLWGLMMNAFYPHRNKPIVCIIHFKLCGDVRLACLLHIDTWLCLDIINSPRMVKGMIGLVKKFINADLFQSVCRKGHQ